MNIKIQIINGPNLNLLGKREPEIYGHLTMEQIETKTKEHSTKKNIDVDFYQSNIEGEIVNKIQDVSEKVSGLIINAAAFTHTSVAILDALNTLTIPKIEIHLSNIYAREEFRHHSYIAPNASGVIFGFGLKGYELAIQSFL